MQKTAYELRMSDCSSDLCSSDLIRHLPVIDGGHLIGLVSIGDLVKYRIDKIEADATAMRDYIQQARSEERRVGKEGVSTCRSRWSTYHSTTQRTTLQRTPQALTAIQLRNLQIYTTKSLLN